MHVVEQKLIIAKIRTNAATETSCKKSVKLSD